MVVELSELEALESVDVDVVVLEVGAMTNFKDRINGIFFS